MFFFFQLPSFNYSSSKRPWDVEFNRTKSNNVGPFFGIFKHSNLDGIGSFEKKGINSSKSLDFDQVTQNFKKSVGGRRGLGCMNCFGRKQDPKASFYSRGSSLWRPIWALFFRKTGLHPALHCEPQTENSLKFRYFWGVYSLVCTFVWFVLHLNWTDAWWIIGSQIYFWMNG